MFDVKTMNGSCRHAEDRRNRVDREDQIGELDQDEHEQQRRRQSPAGLDDEEVLAAVARASSE